MEIDEIRQRRSAILRTLTIPPASAASEQLLELVMDDDIDLPSLAQAIQSEPGITARIVSIANSAFFASPSTIHTVEQAMVKVLGIQTVRSLCMGMLMGPRFNTRACPAFSLQEYWCRALAVAQSSSMLAKCVHNIDAHSVYLAALLHSIGQLLQIHHFPTEMNQLLPKLDTHNNQARLAQEREWLGIDSCEAGNWLAKRWHLPIETIFAIAHFQDPDYQGEHWQVVRIIGFVVRFFEGEEGMAAETARVCTALDIPPDKMQALQENFTDIESSVGVLAEFLAQ
ncbi:MAG: HDOD domain-containing protein [Bermanella sp.]